MPWWAASWSPSSEPAFSSPSCEPLPQADQTCDLTGPCFLEANAATAVLVGVTLGATVSRKFFLFPAVVAGFLLQHAVQGWCPPVPVFRHLGFRTQSEIEEERYALKALRGDFRNLPTGDGQDRGQTARRALEAARQ